MKKYARRRKSGSFLGALLLFLILGALTFGFWKALPYFPTDAGSSRFDRANIILGGTQTALISYNRTNKSLVVVNLSDQIYLEAAHGYGKYRVSSVYPAGELDRRGGETLKATVREYLGIPVDGYYYTSRTLTDLKTFFLSPEFLLEAKSDLGFLDRARLAANIYGVRFDRVKTVDLAKLAGPLILADGSQALSLEPEEIDRALAGSLVENRLQDENLRVEIVNTTRVFGLGSRAMRLLTNTGASVVNVATDQAGQISGCQILANGSVLSGATVSRIAQIYNCKTVKKEEEGRAAVTVLLGQDYADSLTK